MKLNVLERLMLPAVTARIKAKEKFEDLIRIEEIEQSVKITEKELDLYEIETLEDGNVKWNGAKDKETQLELDFTDKEVLLIQEGFREIEKAREVKREFLSLYKKFKEIELALEVEIVE